MTEDVLRVGAIADLSGVQSTVVIRIIYAQTAYWDMVNANGGIAGRQVEFVVRDSNYDVATHLEHYEMMRGTGPDGVVMISHSTGLPHTAAIAEMAVGDNMAVIPLSWYSRWPDPDYGLNIFEQGSNYCYEAINGVDYMAANLVAGDPKLAVISFPSEYGQDGATGAKIAAAALGIEVVYDGEGAVIPGADQTPVIAGLMESGANMVWATISPPEFAEIFGGAGARGFMAQWSGNSPTYKNMLLATPLAPLLDAYYTHSTYTLTWNTEGISGLDSLKAEMSVRTPTLRVRDSYVQGWIEAQAAHQALQRAATNGDLTRAGVVQAFNQITVDHEGLAPNQSWGSDSNDTVVRETYMYDIVLDNYVNGAVGEGGNTGNVLLKGPFASEITLSQIYDGAC